MSTQFENNDALSGSLFVGGNSPPANPVGSNGSPLAASQMANSLTQTTTLSTRQASVPDPWEWMEEHYVMADLFDMVDRMSAQLAAEGLAADNALSVTPDGDLVLSAEAEEILKAQCSEASWQCFEMYLLS